MLDSQGDWPLRRADHREKLVTVDESLRNVELAESSMGGKGEGVRSDIV